MSFNLTHRDAVIVRLIKTLIVALISASIYGCGGGTDFSGGGSGVIRALDAKNSVLTIEPRDATINRGEIQKFSVFVSEGKAPKKNVTDNMFWEISDSKIAELMAAPDKGQAKGVAGGDVTIKASWEGKSVEASLHVKALSPVPATLVKLMISPATLTLLVDDKSQSKAEATYSDGSVKDVTASAIWSSSATTIATVSAPDIGIGKVDAVAVGTATISASFSGLSASCEVKVEPKPPVNPIKLVITPATMTLIVNDKSQLKAEVTYPDGTVKDVTASAVWKSSAPTIATVSAPDIGKVNAVAVGTAAISASYSGLNASSEVKVEAKPLVSPVKLVITPATITLIVNDKSQLKAEATYPDGTVKDVTASAVWKSSAPTIATVSALDVGIGKVNAVAVGTATVSAVFSGLTANSVITVAQNPILTIPPEKQIGKKVRVCFAYDKVKIGGHNCNRAIFDVFAFGAKIGRINLNNSADGRSVEGGIFDGAWDGSGTFKLSTKCTLSRCHKDVAFLSIVGLVEDSNGVKKWLKIEQGRITPDKDYVYKFVDFTLSDKEIEFGPLCTFVTK